MKVTITFLFLCILFLGCSPRYASVYVLTINKQTSESVSAEIYSAKSGLFLGVTPMQIPVKASKQECKKFSLSLIVKEDCFHQDWQLVLIEKWAKTKEESMGADFQNNISFKLIKKPDCN